MCIRDSYQAGFTPICPILYLPHFLNDTIPAEHKDGIDMARDLLRRSHVPVSYTHLDVYKRQLKPIDEEALCAAARETGGIVTAEEHSCLLYTSRCV